MINPVDIERRRLAHLSSPQRISWLRDQIHSTFKDAALRFYFRMPSPRNRSWKEYAIEAAVDIGLARGLTMPEITAAIKGEWSIGTDVAVKAGEKLRIIALSHLKMAGPPSTIHHAFKAARNGFPNQWPLFTDDILEAIAAGFRPASKARRAA